MSTTLIYLVIGGAALYYLFFMGGKEQIAGMIGGLGLGGGGASDLPSTVPDAQSIINDVNSKVPNAQSIMNQVNAQLNAAGVWNKNVDTGGGSKSVQKNVQNTRNQNNYNYQSNYAKRLSI